MTIAGVFFSMVATTLSVAFGHHALAFAFACFSGAVPAVLSMCILVLGTGIALLELPTLEFADELLGKVDEAYKSFKEFLIKPIASKNNPTK